MNTSARIIRGSEPINFVPLPIPAIGEPGASGQSRDTFTVPALDVLALQASSTSSAPFVPSVSPDDVLHNANAEASRIIAEAEESKALIEQAAFEKAELEARSAFESEVAERVSDVREQLLETIEKLSNLSADIVTHVESDLVELAVQIAKKIVRREVSIDREIALTLVRVSLGKLNQRTAAQVHLNPEDLAFVQKNTSSLDFRGALELVEDPSISVGGCLIHTETGDVDGRIESQFDEIAFGLLS